MQFESRHIGNVAVAAPAGRLDHSVSEAFEQSLLPLAGDPNTRALVVDFSGVDYISSVCLRVLMLAAKALRARKGRIAAVSLQPIVAEIFAISRFDSVFEMFPSLPYALGALSPGSAPAQGTPAAPNNA
ncbi:MAG TPA: STAS domain-containing protein [Casimicrobiaceae bacterium]|nr:STAS domain-containing protein [Casimicrobiaceae bacterium]